LNAFRPDVPTDVPTDVRRAMGGGSTPSVIEVRIERLQPLIGVARVDDGAELTFEGWLELIGAIAKLLDSPELPPGRKRREVGRGNDG
jgi:hypothetical protein